MKRIVMVCVVAWAGCGGSSPKEKCNAFVDRVCDRTVECVAEAAGMHDDCVDSFEQLGGCGQVKSVSDSYDSCMSALDDASCQVLFPTDENGDQTVEFPASCSNILRTALAPALRATLARMSVVAR